MPKELLTIYGDIRSKLPRERDNAIVTFDQISPVVDDLETSQIAILKRSHDYDGPGVFWRTECPWMCLTRGAAESLGLLISSQLHHVGSGSIYVHLTHPASQFRCLRLSTLHVESKEPTVGSYVPRLVQRHPWHGEQNDVGPWGYPSVSITNSDDMVATEDDYLRRDVVSLCGKPEAMKRLASLFLDMSRPFNAQTEFDLECEGGFRGVSPLSAELKVLLPMCAVWPSECDMPDA